MSDWIEQIDIAGDRYDLKDLQTEALAQQNAQDIEAIKESVDYSTTEHLTGRKWIDGKPIYSKTFQKNLQGGATEDIGEIQNLDTLVNMEITQKSPTQSNWYSLPQYQNSNYNAYVFIAGNSNVIKINVNGFNGYYMGLTYITAYYTKTTDAPQP